MLIGVGVLCHIFHILLLSINTSYISFNMLITSVGEEMAIFSAIVYL